MILATLCYIKRNGKILMLHRVKKENDMHKGKWNGLGGKVEPGETPEECVLREVKEECGLTVTRLWLKGILTFPAFDEIEDWYVVVFVAEAEGDITTPDSEEGYLKWVEASELSTLPLWEGDRIFLKWLDQREFFSAKFIYDKGRLVNHYVTFY